MPNAPWLVIFNTLSLQYLRPSEKVHFTILALSSLYPHLFFIKFNKAKFVPANSAHPFLPPSESSGAPWFVFFRVYSMVVHGKLGGHCLEFQCSFD